MRRLIFAFPGTGKTTLGRENATYVDMEVSPFKHKEVITDPFLKEQLKLSKRPVQKGYKKRYKVAVLNQDQIPLIALDHIWLFFDYWKSLEVYIPPVCDFKVYMERYARRGNNPRFIKTMRLLYYPTTILGYLVSKATSKIHILPSDSYLSDVLK